MFGTSEIMILYAGVFIGVLLLVEGLYQLFAARFGRDAHINRRLRMLDSGTDPQDVLRTLRRQPNGSSAFVRRVAVLARLERLLGQAGLDISAPRLLTIMAALGAALYGVFRLGLGTPTFVALAVGGAAGIGLPLLYVSARRHRRLKRFAEQLPDALELIVRSLRAGHPMTAALGMVAQEMSDPIGSEFGVAVDEITYGLALEDALSNLGERVGVPEVHYMAVLINIQHGTGGNLAEVLMNLAKIIRDRAQMFRKIRAVTAEARFSGVFLSAFPFVVLAVVNAIYPDYYSQVADDPRFMPLAVTTFVLLTVNILVMRKLTNLRI